MKTTRIFALSLACTFALMAMAQTTFAQIVPFRARGTDAVYSPVDTQFTTGEGRATHMGKVTASGFVYATPTADPFVFDWVLYQFKLTAANGDQISFEGGGTVEFIGPNADGLFIAVWTADNHVTGGTGRFANVGPANSPLTVSAVNDPLSLPAISGDVWTYSWTIEGKINLGRKRGR